LSRDPAVNYMLCEARLTRPALSVRVLRNADRMIIEERKSGIISSTPGTAGRRASPRGNRPQLDVALGEERAQGERGKGQIHEQE
jgi:hypothetical protein